MKKLSLALLFAVLTSTAVSATPYGIFWTSVKEPVAATSLSSYSKKASGSATSFLGMIGIGDASIQSIAKKAGITRIKHVDKETTMLPFGIINTETFTVYGD